MTTRFTVEPLAEALEDAGFVARWDALAASGGGAFPFLSSDWLAAWDTHLGSGREVVFALLERDGELVGGLPLVSGPSRLGRWRVRMLEVAGAPLFDRIEIPAVDEAARRATLESIVGWFRAERGETVLNLRELASGGETHRALDAGGFRFHLRTCSRAPLLELAELKRSRNLRSQLKRGERRLAELGSLEDRFTSPDPGELPELLDECAAVESASWKGEGGVLGRSPTGAFFRELAAGRAHRGAVLLGQLRLDGRLVAYHLGLRHGDRFLSYNLAHLPEHGAAGPGTVLLDRMVARGAELGLATFDASRGSLERPHLLARYRGPVREHLQAVLYRRGPVGAGLELVRHVLLPAARRLRSTVRGAPSDNVQEDAA